MAVAYTSLSKQLAILAFINKRHVISSFDLVEESRYTPGGARSHLSVLKKKGLVINADRGLWSMTDRGIDKLIYYKMW